jgi:hypothetical protein
MKRHPECLLEVHHTIDGTEYDCGYEHAPECDACIFGPLSEHGGVGIDPRTGRRKHVRKMRQKIEADGTPTLDIVWPGQGIRAPVPKRRVCPDVQ